MKTETKKTKKSSFSGQLGFVMAAAGSAVGVGNIWRFPYLAAKDGGGLFLIIYLILILTFGFALLATDTAIGRRTGKNALQAFAELGEKYKFIGFITFLVPVLIITYYTVIGLYRDWRMDPSLHFWIRNLTRSHISSRWIL